jgi:threonine dehydrogenase-like Zn-dependent dehydrogenase
MRALVLNGEWEPRPGAQLSEEEHARHWARDARQAWRHPRWSVQQHPDPIIAVDDDVIVRVRAAGIAGSNVRMSATDDEGYVLLPYHMHLPRVPGHEIAGEVVEVGSAVQSLRRGDPVCVEALRACMQCAICLRGKVNQCLHPEFTGFTIDGGFSEYLVARERQVRPLAALRTRFDENVIYEIGALAEPAAIAYNGMFLRADGFSPGANVAVFGCGPIGLAAIALARNAGAGKVIAFDVDAHRCALAGKLGADVALDVRNLVKAGSRPAREVLEHTSGLGADFIVEAAGNHRAVLPEIETSLAVYAKVVLLGVEGNTAPAHMFSYQQKAASLFGMMGHIGGYDPIIALHAAGRLDLTPMIDARYDLQHAITAIERAAQRTDAKILLVPNESSINTAHV